MHNQRVVASSCTVTATVLTKICRPCVLALNNLNSDGRRAYVEKMIVSSRAKWAQHLCMFSQHQNLAEAAKVEHAHIDVPHAALARVGAVRERWEGGVDVLH